MPDEIPTPRTNDVQCSSIPNICDHPDAVYTVPVKFARNLERELTAARVELALAQSTIEAYKRQGTWTPIDAKAMPQRVPMLLAWIAGNTVHVHEGYCIDYPARIFLRPSGKQFESVPTHWRVMPQPILG